MPGCLHHTSPETHQLGFLSFIRLIGTCYFKKYLAAFVALKGHKMPHHSMNSIDPSLQPKERHKVWLNTIREVVSDRIINEEDRVPTFTSLWRHWLRSCWVSQMWQHSSQDDISTLQVLPPPESSGWLLQADGNYIIDWEAHDVQQMIKDNIEFLTKRCSCTKGCRTLRCGCRKKHRNCGPGCLCQDCTNLNISESPPDDSSSESDNSESCDEVLESEIVEEKIVTDDACMILCET